MKKIYIADYNKKFTSMLISSGKKYTFKRLNDDLTFKILIKSGK